MKWSLIEDVFEVAQDLIRTLLKLHKKPLKELLKNRAAGPSEARKTRAKRGEGGEREGEGRGADRIEL